jgi:hypothetical protein
LEATTPAGVICLFLLPALYLVLEKGKDPAK